MLTFVLPESPGQLEEAQTVAPVDVDALSEAELHATCQCRSPRLRVAAACRLALPRASVTNLCSARSCDQRTAMWGPAVARRTAMPGCRLCQHQVRVVRAERNGAWQWRVCAVASCLRFFNSSRAFKLLPPASRASLVQALCHSAGEVPAAMKELGIGQAPSSGDPIVVAHRNACLQHAFFLKWLLAQTLAQREQEEKEERSSAAEQGAA